MFKKYPNNTIHYFQQTSNTGLSLDLLQEFIFIPLDITNKIYQNDNVIDNKLDAWFIFLSNDDPKTIAKLISQFPEFKQMYHEIYEVCKNTKWVMNMFSEELRILDKNTELLMLEEAKAEIEQRNAEIEQRNAEIEQRNAEIEQMSAEIEQKDAEIELLKKKLAELQNE